MKHRFIVVRRLKLTDFELRVLIDSLNAKRLKQKASGIDHSDTSDLLLYLIDALEGGQMEFISFAIHFAALVFLTVIIGGLMNYFMNKKGFAYNPYLTYLLLPIVVVALYLVGGFSMWTVKGIVFFLILLYASVQDLSEHQADDFLWVMLLILSLVNIEKVGITSMIFGVLAVFLPQFIVVMFFKTKGQGGADFKFSTSAALCLGFYGGVIGYMIGLVFAIVFQTIYNKIKKQSNNEAFPLLPFISTGLMIGYFI